MNYTRDWRSLIEYDNAIQHSLLNLEFFFSFLDKSKWLQSRNSNQVKHLGMTLLWKYWKMFWEYRLWIYKKKFSGSVLASETSEDRSTRNIKLCVSLYTLGGSPRTKKSICLTIHPHITYTARRVQSGMTTNPSACRNVINVP